MIKRINANNTIFGIMISYNDDPILLKDPTDC